MKLNYLAVKMCAHWIGIMLLALIEVEANIQQRTCVHLCYLEEWMSQHHKRLKDPQQQTLVVTSHCSVVMISIKLIC